MTYSFLDSSLGGSRSSVIVRRPFQVIGTWMRPEFPASPTTLSTLPYPSTAYFVGRMFEVTLLHNILIICVTHIYNKVIRYGGIVVGVKGWKHTPETRAKMSAAHKGATMSAEARAKISESLKGHSISAETLQKISAALKGRPSSLRGFKHSEESRANMSAAKKGKTLTAEHRQKLSVIGKMKTIPEEQRQKIAETLRGRKRPPEVVAKVSAAMMGKTHTPEARAKISKGLQGHQVSPETIEKIRCAQSGERAWNWQGGISYEPYCVKFNNAFKERVREFFGRKCAECGAPENGTRLHVHHVNYHKGSRRAEGVPPLFVALCQSCHARSNHGREYWEEHFTTMINEQYGGQCYLPKEATVPEEVSA